MKRWISRFHRSVALLLNSDDDAPYFNLILEFLQIEKEQANLFVGHLNFTLSPSDFRHGRCLLLMRFAEKRLNERRWRMRSGHQQKPYIKDTSHFRIIECGFRSQISQFFCRVLITTLVLTEANVGGYFIDTLINDLLVFIVANARFQLVINCPVDSKECLATMDFSDRLTVHECRNLTLDSTLAFRISNGHSWQLCMPVEEHNRWEKAFSHAGTTYLNFEFSTSIAGLLLIT